MILLLQDAKKSHMDFHPLLQINWVFLYNSHGQLCLKIYIFGKFNLKSCLGKCLATVEYYLLFNKTVQSKKYPQSQVIIRSTPTLVVRGQFPQNQVNAFLDNLIPFFKGARWIENLFQDCCKPVRVFDYILLTGTKRTDGKWFFWVGVKINNCACVSGLFS